VFFTATEKGPWSSYLCFPCSWDDRHAATSPTGACPPVAGISNGDSGHWGSLAGSNIYSAGTDWEDSCTKAEPQEQRGLTLYTLVSRLQKQKAKLNIWLHVTSLAILFPSARWPSCFNSLSFLSLLCHPFPLPHYQNTACLFFFWPPPCYIILPFDAQTHPGSKSIILI
jgi:hypothetical protein